MKTSLIFTIKNEGKNLALLLNSILFQSKMPNEVIVVDGGSTDNSVQILQEYYTKFKKAGIQYVYKSIPDANISQGRNMAIQLSTAPVIAATDGGSILDKDWFLNITEPLLKEEADMVGGFYKAVAHSNFQKALAAVTTSPKPVKNFLPSSRSIAFTRRLWSKVGGYPEWLQWGEDTLFNKLCLESGARYIVRADAVVYWEVRPNISVVARQHYRYSYSDGLSGTLKLSNIFSILYFMIILISGLPHQYYVLAFLLLIYPQFFIVRHIRSIKTSNIIWVYILIYLIHSTRSIGFLIGTIKRFKK